MVWNIFYFSTIYGIILPIDKYFSDGLKPPTSIYTLNESYKWDISGWWLLMCYRSCWHLVDRSHLGQSYWSPHWEGTMGRYLKCPIWSIVTPSMFPWKCMELAWQSSPIRNVLTRTHQHVWTKIWGLIWATTLRYYNDTLSMYCIIYSIRSCWNMLKLSKHVSCAGFPLIGIYDQWMTRRRCAKVHLGLPVRAAVCCKYRASQSAEVGGLWSNV